MCRATAGPLLVIMGVAGTMAGVGLAIVRERIDRRADSRATKEAAEEQASSESESRRADSNSEDDD